jgi:CDP-paratose 2-epimerase
MNILITGGAGFIGSNFAIYYKSKHPESKVICLDNLKRKGSELNLLRLQEKDISFIHGDVRNEEDLNLKEKIDILVECSAEPSVMAGLDGSPKYVIDSNLGGAINCLEQARKQKSKFVFLSTSRVYPYSSLLKLDLKEEKTRFSIDKMSKGASQKGISEDFPLKGIRSIYGATKLCAEHLINEYNAAYGLETIINRCGVIAGPWQMGKVDQGVFSLWMARHYFNKPLNYIGFGGQGKQVRDLLHVDDLCSLLNMQLDNFDIYNGKTYNAGGGDEVSLSLLETTKLCEGLTGNKIQISSVKENRPADIPYYVSDTFYLRKESGWKWKPEKSSKDIMTDIYSWIKANEDKLKDIF